MSNWPQKPFILAHRGARAHAPENTLEASQKAIELGADGIECDIFLSQDGVPVVIHDETLNRTTQGHGFVWNHSAQTLEQFGLPTLEQTLECLPNSSVINIELKDCQPYAPAYWINFIEDLLKHHRHRLGIILSSFNPELLEGWDKAYAIGLLFEAGQSIQVPNTLRPDALHLNPPSLRAVPNGFKTVLWTAKDSQEAKLWLAQGADGVIAEF